MPPFDMMSSSRIWISCMRRMASGSFLYASAKACAILMSSFLKRCAPESSSCSKVLVLHSMVHSTSALSSNALQATRFFCELHQPLLHLRDVRPSGYSELLRIV